MPTFCQSVGRGTLLRPPSAKSARAPSAGSRVASKEAWAESKTRQHCTPTFAPNPTAMFYLPLLCGVPEKGWMKSRERLDEIPRFDLPNSLLRMAVGQNQWYHFGVGAPPTLVYFSGGLGCSLGVRDFDPWPYLLLPPRIGQEPHTSRGPCSARSGSARSARAPRNLRVALKQPDTKAFPPLASVL